MAIKRTMPNKKVIISIVIAVILLIVAVTGTVAFLKDRGRTEAADLENMQQTTGSNEQIIEPGQENNQGQDNNSQNGEPVASEGNVGEQNNGVQSTANGNNANNTQNNNRPNQTTDNIQESTITRVETVETPEKQTYQGSYIGWSATRLNGVKISNKINTESNNGKISISKKATTKSGKNVVIAGEEITYTITVTNNTENKVSNVEVKDIIPANTKYVEGSADNGAVKVGNGLMWTLDIEGKSTVELTFKVTVNKDVTGEITNIAYANNEKTEPVKTAVIKSYKTAVVTDKDGKTQAVARIGDIINYTISVENTGDVEGATKVQDAKLKEYIDNGILEIVKEPSNITLDELYTGKEITISNKTEMKIEFSARIVKINGEISNTATIGGEDKTATVTTRDIDIKKEASLVKADKNNKTEYKDKAEVGDTINYVVTVTNNGSEELKDIKITDSMWTGADSIDLKAGESREIKYSHKVISTDIANENIHNVVTAKYDGKDEDKDEKDTPVRKDYAYRVEYYYDNEKDNNKTENGKEEYGKTVTVSGDKVKENNKDGYKPASDNNLSVSITENEETNVIKVYYVRDSFEYTVEYYYDEVKDDSKTTDPVKATFGETISTYTDKAIDGYRFDKVIPTTITSNPTNNVVRVYYVKDETQKHSVKAQIEYYYGDTLEVAKAKTTADATEEVETAETWIGTEATVTVAPNTTNKFTGYKYQETVGDLSYSVEANAETDTIVHKVKVYYVKDENQKHSVKAQVEYYYGDTLEVAKAKTTADATEEVETAETWIGEVATVTVTPNTTNKFTGYRHETTEGNLSYSVEANAETDTTVHKVKVYYVKDENQKHSVKAQVEYYYGDTLVEAQAKTTADATDVVETAETWIGTEATVTVAPNTTNKFTGYKYQETVGNLSYSVEANAETDTTVHKVKVYYVKDENQKHSVKAQVEYYYGDTLVEAQAKTTADATDVVETVETWIGEVATVTVTPNTTNKFTGYRHETTEGNLSYSVEANAETDATVHKVKVYYVKDETQKHSVKAQIEYYYGDTLVEAKAKTTADATEEVETAETWIGEVATVTVAPNTTNKFTGYKYQETVGNLSYSVEANAETDTTVHKIKVYYVKDSFSYKVKYQDENGNTLADTKIGDKQLFGTIVNENAISITGYDLVNSSETTKTLEISANEDENVIVFIYKAKKCKYTVNYFYNGSIAVGEGINEELDADYGETIPTYTPKTSYNGKTYKLDRVETTDADKKMPLTIGLENNVINVYYIRPEVTIGKTATTNVENTGIITYTITVRNSGMQDAENLTVTDTLPTQLDMTEISDITPNTGKYKDGKITWTIDKIAAGSNVELTFKAKVKIDTIGENIENSATVTFEDETITTTTPAQTKVNDKTVTVKEITEGKDADNLNIIFIMDNSSSMNRPKNGENYANTDGMSNNNYYVAPTDTEKTRLYAAKEATKEFINTLYSDPKMNNTNMSVITFNNEENDTENQCKIGRGPLTYIEGRMEGYKYIRAHWEDSDKNTVESKNVKQATDGQYYEILNNNIRTGAIEVGSGTTANHSSLIENVNNISIGVKGGGLGTHINPALKMANDKVTAYKKQNKNKNIVIVLGDGAISDMTPSNLKTLKQNANDIYCIRFGNESSADSNLATISTSTKGTSDKLYIAGNESELINKFKSILDDAKTPPVDRTTGNKKQNGIDLVANIESGEIVAKTSKAITYTKPLVIKQNGKVIITCNSDDDLAQYGIKYDATNRVLRWNLNECLRKENGISDLSGKLELEYYIPNN